MDGSVITFGLEELERASARVHEVVPPTPQYAWPKLRSRLGCSVWVKHENHTPTGAFKVRGGIVFVDRLIEAQRGALASHGAGRSSSGDGQHPVSGLITATRGNHGQSIAFAAARAGIPATIYVPQGNSPDQNASMAAFGATVVEFGNDFDEARHEAHRVSTDRNLHFVPSFHRDLVAGVASYGLELFRAVTTLDAVYVGVGMGSGICSLIAVRDLMGSKSEIIGVSAANAPATARSFLAGRPVHTDTALTFADGLATRQPAPDVVATICKGAARMIEVSEDEIAEAIRIYWDDTHQVAEGAGAAPLAALIKERQRMAGKNVAVILTGGNIERARLLQVLSGQTPSA